MKKLFKSFVSISTILIMAFSPFSALTPTSAFAADTGNIFPSSVVDSGIIGSQAWSSPSNAKNDDTSYASVSLSKDQISHYLRATNFGFNIPSDAVINGIEVKVERKASDSDRISDNIVKIVKGGLILGDNKADTATEWGSSFSVKTYGSNTDKWGTTWTPSDINASNFGVVFSAKHDSSDNTKTAYVDYISIKVYYTEVAPNPQLNQSCGLDIALVIDSSGSIDAAELVKMKNAFQDFVNAFLPETPTEFSVTDFDNYATVLQGFTGDSALINSAINLAASGGATNWEDGLLKAYGTFDPRTDHPNLVIFASDGNPTVNNGPYGSNTGNTTDGNDLSNAILQANIIKNAGVRIITFGIGNELNIDNLKAISGTNVDTGITSDVVTTDFETLAQDLAAFAGQLCGKTITARKIIDQDGDIQTTGDQTPGAGWNFSVASSSQITDESGYTQAVEVCVGTYNVSETIIKDGYNFITASCTGATNNGMLLGSTISGIQVNNEDIVSCVFYNSPQCVPSSEVCDGLDNDCDGLIDEGNVCQVPPACGDASCNGQETCETCPQDCGTCSSGCIIDADCDNGLFCDGQETCLAGQCVAGTPISCSNNNLCEIATCTNIPDNNIFTWDFRNAFVSVCNEDTNSCTLVSQEGAEITHTCSVNDCQAQCDATHPCAETNCQGRDVCEGNDLYDFENVANTCQEDCTCTNNDCTVYNIIPNSPACTDCQTNDDCNDLNQTYCLGSVVKHDEGVCNENYKCAVNTTQVTECNNGLACDGTETCQDGQCVQGTAVVCSVFNLSGIATCTNDPDNDPFTWDFRNAFNSACQEPTGICTTATEEQTIITHICDKQCDAPCAANSDCDDQNSNTTDTCNLNTCQCENVEIPACTGTSTQSCSTGLQGVCSSGIQTCAGGQWGICIQTTESSTEVCTDGLDNDCDGATDAADPNCWQCTPQATSTCSTELSGVCSAGTQICGTNGFWGTCLQNTASSAEVCSDQLDNDCDGVVDNGCQQPPTLYCGDGSCNNGETCSSCSQDCGACGGGGGGGGGTGPTILSIFNEQVDTASIGLNSVTITWDTNKLADSRLVFGAYNESHTYDSALPNYGYSNTNAVNSDEVGSHSMTLAGLLPGTTYYVRAVSTQTYESAVSTELTFTTKAVAGAQTQETPVVTAPPAEEAAGSATGEESIVIPEPEVAGAENINIPPEVAGAASVGFFAKNICLIILLILIILTIWHFVEVMRKRKRGEKEGLILPIIVLVLLILYFYRHCYANYYLFWILLVINAILFLISMTVKEKKAKK